MDVSIKSTQSATILWNHVIEKVKLSNTLVRINENNVFYTIVINPNSIPKTLNFINLDLEPIHNLSLNALDEQLNEEKDLITELCIFTKSYSNPEIHKQAQIKYPKCWFRE